ERERDRLVLPARGHGPRQLRRRPRRRRGGRGSGVRRAARDPGPEERHDEDRGHLHGADSLADVTATAPTATAAFADSRPGAVMRTSGTLSSIAVSISLALLAGRATG